ncbi:MAG: FIST N-terminal domain-containing protein [bacterium]
MPSVSVISTRNNPRHALMEVMDLASTRLSGRKAALACLFVTADFAFDLGEMARELLTQGLAAHVIGVTAESVAASDKEVEQGPALGLWLLDIPGIEIQPLRITYEDGQFPGWQEPSPVADESGRVLVLLADPFSFPADEFLDRLNATGNSLRVIGGMASAGRSPGMNRLVIDDAEYHAGAVGVLISGDVTIRTVVSQGCRPIGRHMIVTKAERNLIAELGRRNALDVLQEIFTSLEGPDRERVRAGLHLGRVVNEYQEKFGRGDFLVRNVIGGDNSGRIAVNDNLRIGQTVQFHVRDGATADEDLRSMLAAVATTPEEQNPEAALLFTCNGRGRRLFEIANHDISTIHEVLGPVPTAGFFAMGELGPIGPKNFIHGFTASIGLFYAKPRAKR